MSRGSTLEPGVGGHKGSAELRGGLPEWFLVEDAAEAEPFDAQSRIVVRRVSASRPLMAVIVLSVLVFSGVGAWLTASLARFDARQTELLLRVDRLDLRVAAALESSREASTCAASGSRDEVRPILESMPR